MSTIRDDPPEFRICFIDRAGVIAVVSTDFANKLMDADDDFRFNASRSEWGLFHRESVAIVGTQKCALRPFLPASCRLDCRS